ncbi:MAG: DNA-binding protein Alba [Methanosphaera sp.]|nr:DNA-binding protein Alba [Methanosphaera sp.]
MSDNLSFTQELRKNGIIRGDIQTNNVKNNETKDNSTDSVDFSKHLSEGNIIYIGKKPSMSYVITISSIMHEGVDELTIKARGRTISKAVDVAEIVTNKFVPNSNDEDVKISTEEITREDGTTSNVSTIEIVISKE